MRATRITTTTSASAPTTWSSASTIAAQRQQKEIHSTCGAIRRGRGRRRPARRYFNREGQLGFQATRRASIIRKPNAILQLMLCTRTSRWLRKWYRVETRRDCPQEPRRSRARLEPLSFAIRRTPFLNSQVEVEVSKTSGFERRVDERCDFCRRLRHRLPTGRSQYSTLLFAPIVLCCIVLYCPNVEVSIRAARFRCLSFISSSSSRRGLTRIETMLTDDRSGFIKSRRHPNNKKRNGSILKA